MAWRQEWVLDRYAFAECRAIVLVETRNHDRAQWAADESAYRTVWSKALSSAANGDWELLKEMCRRERDRAGEEAGRELMHYAQTLHEEYKCKGKPMPRYPGTHRKLETTEASVTALKWKRI